MNLNALPQNGHVGFSAAGGAVVLGGAVGMNPGVDGGPVVAEGGCSAVPANCSANVPVAGLISSIAAVGSRFGNRALPLLTVGLA